MISWEYHVQEMATGHVVMEQRKIGKVNRGLGDFRVPVWPPSSGAPLACQDLANHIKFQSRELRNLHISLLSRNSHQDLAFWGFLHGSSRYAPRSVIFVQLTAVR